MSQPNLPNPIASAYDNWSQTYETMENATRDLAARVLRQKFPDLIGRDVLEIGCGTGVNTRYLASQGKTVLAADFSSGMLEKARANVSAKNVLFEQWDIRNPWNLPDASVDLIFCTLVLEHVKNLDAVFREAVRVLRPGGEFFFCELHSFRQLKGGQAQFLDASSGKNIFVPAFHHDVSAYVNTSIQCGFQLIHLGEWWDEKDKTSGAAPRLLSLHLRSPA